MRRLMLLWAVLAAAVGCRSADNKAEPAKPEPAAKAEPSRWNLPKIITTEDWWRKGEMGDLEH